MQEIVPLLLIFTNFVSRIRPEGHYEVNFRNDFINFLVDLITSSYFIIQLFVDIGKRSCTH